ncbi:MAG: nitroreductase family protein [Desulfarculales bacterium]|jgi:hypothetical protein|nr:nitroreductase family protein [Desulfarculales bacterium]
MLARVLLSTIFVFTLASAAASADIVLPPPLMDYHDQPGIFKLLQNRASITPRDKISPAIINMQDISNLLWAASGLNRPEARGWVVPIASASAPQPYWRLYALTGEGVFIYNWRKHELLLINRRDARSKILNLPSMEPPPLVLAFVVDGFLLEDFHENTEGSYKRIDLGVLAVGAMTQNVFLACEALGMKTNCILNLGDYEDISKLLSLSQEDSLICAMPVWYETAR